MPRAPRSIVQPSSDAVMQTLAWLRKNGFRPVPLHYRSKAAMSRAYVALDYKPPDDDLWRTSNLGVGAVTGPAYGSFVDSDLDNKNAAYFAQRFFPPTPAVFGRASKPMSHYLYRVDTPTFEKLTFNDPVTKQTILELRGDGGHQTVMPGSIHETTGEPVEWSSAPFPDVPTVPSVDLIRAARKTAMASLITDYVWAPGYHNEPTKHLTGMLYYLEWTLDEVVDLIQAVMDYTGDTDKSRIPTVRATYKRGEAGKKISGAGVLRKQLKNDDVVDMLQELAGSPTVNLLTEYNEKYSTVNLKGKFRIASMDVPPGEPPEFFELDHWRNYVATDYSDLKDDKGRPIPKSKLWLSNPRRRSYRGADFMPGQTETGDILNLWTGWAVPPAATSKGCEAWLELVRDVICGGNEFNFRWLLHWFANILRDPADKSLTAPVIIGPEGAGKSLMVTYFGRVLGSAFVVVTNDEHIHGKFNNHLGQCLLLHSEEALYAGDKKHASIIRSLITDQHRIYEKKGIDAVMVRNYLRLLLTSNDIHAAPAKPGDRRYSPFDMGDRKVSDELRDRVLAEMDNGGPAALHRYLLEMEYDPAVPRTNIKNDSLLAMKAINMTPSEQWWYDTLSIGVMLPDYLAWASVPDADGRKPDWPEAVSSVALHAAMTIRLRERGARQIPSDTMLAFQLNKFTGTGLIRSRKEFSNPLSDEAPSIVKQMSARQSTIVNMPDLETCRKAFEKYVGQKLEWPEPDNDEPRKEKPHDKY